MVILAGELCMALQKGNAYSRLGFTFLVGCSLSIATLIIQQALIAQQAAQLDRRTQLHAAWIAEQISEQINSRIQALIRMAERWDKRGGTPKEEWEADANNYLKDFPGYQTIKWIDSEFRERWSVPSGKHDTILKPDITEAIWRQAQQPVANQRLVKVSSTLKLAQGHKGFQVYVPLLPHQKFGGLIVGVFDTERLLETIVSRMLAKNTIWQNYSIVIFEGADEIYRREPNNTPHHFREKSIQRKQETQIQWDGIIWRLQIWPSPKLLAVEQSLLPNAILIAGLLTAWLLALAVYLAQTARFHAKAVEASNRELQAAIEEQKRTWEALSRLSHQNELILNSAGEGIFGLDKDLKITFVNPAAARMLGYPIEELIGMPMSAISCQPSKQQVLSSSPGRCCPKEQCPIQISIEEGFRHEISDRLFWRKDGTSFPVEYVSTPIREQNQISGAVVVFKDISERQAVEKMKDEFISMVSHELLTPLTSIRAAIGLLASGLLKTSPEKVQRMLEIALANTERLAHLIDDILELERIESGSLTLKKQFCNAADLMQHSINSVQSLAHKANITLSVMPVEAALYVEPNRILQTLTNLLSNAIKFSPPGATVWLSAECSKEYIIFKIKDQGRGIPSDKLDLIFERFQQLDTSDARSYGGTGLGLAICRSIVQQHGGRIWAESELGVGSTFFFTLPLLKELPARESISSRNPAS
ncbi:MAG: ATP-binding protein [Oscillatoriaceae bacterium SKW80]|nr:ATP-binding protein [Oscillatoriaceae bacterium SKYG93]MCX8121995.1 ATP-binding protein [Oscillatoriaceae bacterium SKW80]MDW8454281.1 ATP-binding protein [Oscillatoriaceae cyanobacterium SKYGB_i_bin93]HIK29145.1 PAS domain S-box protein [Oscillatoriaceae cyanobacterium M7585_C2015_266]